MGSSFGPIGSNEETTSELLIRKKRGDDFPNRNHLAVASQLAIVIRHEDIAVRNTCPGEIINAPTECYKTREPPIFERLVKALFGAGRIEERLQNGQNVTSREGSHQSGLAGLASRAVGHVGVNHRIRDILVPGAPLDRIYVRVLRGHHGAERVTERMRMVQVRRDAGAPRILLEQPQKLHSSHYPALLRWEQDLRTILDALFQPRFQGGDFIE